MADIDVDWTPFPYYELDPNNCVCPADAVPSAPVSPPILANVEDAQLEDIYFDVSAEHGPDYSVTPAGDWLPVTGDEALRQSLLREYNTNPGEWQTNPQYGAGGRAFLKAKSTKASRDAFAARLRARSLADSRVESVNDVQQERFADGGWKFHVIVIPKGRTKRSNPVTVTFEAP